jgi:hypothetical protein
LTAIEAPEPVTGYDPVAYQTSLSQAQAGIKTVLKRRQLDPLRYIVDIDQGLPVFAVRDIHQLRIAYNHYPSLSMEVAIPHQWMVEQTGQAHDQFLLAVDDLVLALKGKVQAAGRVL